MPLESIIPGIHCMPGRFLLYYFLAPDHKNSFYKKTDSIAAYCRSSSKDVEVGCCQFHYMAGGCRPISRISKRLRQQELVQYIEAHPFVTDEDLTKRFEVSIQTIRLDRLELGIPELRERIKQMAEQSLDPIRSLPLHEVIGEVIDLQLDKSGISMFDIKEEHVFSRTKIARGHHIFSQANSLAVAVINDEIALTGSANIRFVRQVKLQERCVAKAYVRSISRGKAKVDVQTYVNDELVFEGRFLIVHSND